MPIGIQCISMEVRFLLGFFSPGWLFARVLLDLLKENISFHCQCGQITFLFSNFHYPVYKAYLSICLKNYLKHTTHSLVNVVSTIEEVLCTFN